MKWIMEWIITIMYMYLQAYRFIHNCIAGSHISTIYPFMMKLFPLFFLDQDGCWSLYPCSYLPSFLRKYLSVRRPDRENPRGRNHVLLDVHTGWSVYSKLLYTLNKTHFDPCLQMISIWNIFSANKWFFKNFCFVRITLY